MAMAADANTPTTIDIAKRKERRIRPNENKMSDGGRERAALGVEVCKSSQKWSVQRSAVRSIVFHEKAFKLKMKFISLLC